MQYIMSGELNFIYPKATIPAPVTGKMYELIEKYIQTRPIYRASYTVVGEKTEVSIDASESYNPEGIEDFVKEMLSLGFSKHGKDDLHCFETVSDTQIFYKTLGITQRRFIFVTIYSKPVQNRLC